MKPERAFLSLTILGLAAGGWLYGDYWKKSNFHTGSSEDASSLRAQNSDLLVRIDALESDLAQARSMLTNSPYPIADELIAWIETEYNMAFLRPPDVRLATPAAIRDAAESNLHFIHRQGKIEAENRAWELLGILPPNQNLWGQLITISSSGVKGIFDYRKERILLSEEFNPSSVPDRSVLVRLLGQAISFQNHPQKEWLSRDHWQAWEAVHVGTAAALASRFIRRNMSEDEDKWQDPEAAREQQLNELAPALQGFANFPFLEGADYSRFFFVQSRAKFAEMFRGSSLTTDDILKHTQKNSAKEGITFSGPDENIVIRDQLGALGLRLWLEPFAGVMEAQAYADTWKADTYELRQDGLKETLIWHLDLASSKASQSLVSEIERSSMLAHFREMQPAREITVFSSGPRVTFTNSPKTQ